MSTVTARTVVPVAEAVDSGVPGTLSASHSYALWVSPNGVPEWTSPVVIAVTDYVDVDVTLTVSGCVDSVVLVGSAPAGVTVDVATLQVSGALVSGIDSASYEVTLSAYGCGGTSPVSRTFTMTTVGYGLPCGRPAQSFLWRLMGMLTRCLQFLGAMIA